MSVIYPRPETLIYSTRLIPGQLHGGLMHEGTAISYKFRGRIADTPDFQVPQCQFEDEAPFVLCALQQSSMIFTGGKRLSLANQKAFYLNMGSAQDETYAFKRTSLLTREKLSEDQNELLARLRPGTIFAYGLSSLMEASL